MKALVAVLGLDSHWRGAVMVARALRDAGAEVVYLGNQFPAQLAAMALEEDAQLLAISSLSGNHATLVPELMRLLRVRGAGGVRVVVGGAIPPADVPALREAGVADVFPPGRPLDALLALVRRLLEEERGAPASADGR
ncbi:MAG: cobalamin-dependent protein [candidate division NC10 bacterium]